MLHCELKTCPETLCGQINASAPSHRHLTVRGLKALFGPGAKPVRAHAPCFLLPRVASNDEARLAAMVTRFEGTHPDLTVTMMQVIQGLGDMGI